MDAERAPEIRPASRGDLSALVVSLGQPRYFADRITRQENQRGVLLIAWHTQEPIGDIYLSLEPPEEPELRAALPRIQILTHLEVREDHRNRRIGTALLGEAERYLRGRGHRQVGLGVSRRNVAAIRLYERLGYLDWARPDLSTRKEILLDGGGVLLLPETCRVFVKNLL